MASDPPVLDPTLIGKLRKLEELAGAGFLREVIGLFLTPLTERVVRLKTHAAKGDARGIEDEAHALRGSAAQVGALEVAALCAALEEAARAKDVRDAAPLVERLEAAAVRARAALEREA